MTCGEHLGPVPNVELGATVGGMRRRSSAASHSWQVFTAAVPWLTSLPDEISWRLDLSELVVPDGEAARLRAAVEQALPAYVMTYRRPATSTPPPGRLRLCEVVTPAVLDPASLAILKAAEEQLTAAEVILCAYANPLQVRCQDVGNR
jgi:hypothetical protein